MLKMSESEWFLWFSKNAKRELEKNAVAAASVVEGPSRCSIKGSVRTLLSMHRWSPPPGKQAIRRRQQTEAARFLQITPFCPTGTKAKLVNLEVNDPSVWPQTMENIEIWKIQRHENQIMSNIYIWDFPQKWKLRYLRFLTKWDFQE